MPRSNQVSRFLLTGGATVVIDLATYRLLLWFELGLPPAKAISFMIGAAFAYAANRVFTFNAEHDTATFVRFWIIYLGNLMLNVAVNTLALTAFPDIQGRLTLAFLVATAISAAANFVGMKHFVFTKSAKPS